jgi:hypothetical protein
MTRVVGYVDDDDGASDSAISGFMKERLLHFPARAPPIASAACLPNCLAQTGAAVL